MSKRGPQLPRIKPVGRAGAANPPHPHRDGDLAYGMPETAGHAWENWPQAGYLAQGHQKTSQETLPGAFRPDSKQQNGAHGGVCAPQPSPAGDYPPDQDSSASSTI